MKVQDADFWDEAALRYAAREVMDPAAYEATLARTRHHLSPDHRVLEIGCGTAATALRLTDAVAEYVASDRSAGMLRQARARLDRADCPNLSLLQAGLDDPALAGAGPFDALLAFNLLHLLPGLETGLASIRGLLKPGGLFISKTICPKCAPMPLAYRAAFLAWPLLRRMGRVPPDFRHLQVSELDAAITGAGFEVVETGYYPARPPSRFVVARLVA
ncbi:Ubiquinone/menaquinone biosynthesis C-methylase UbiE [Lutimaribacter pacificus]|uniref:Ubiquinone/menaquinone biosynthesis C-methylase UbiE n=1 Tax=Lutimaribacter pacificus TaxID=391948 RepID=A0A1H0EWZ0_9RHOB|nr:class I SAM-dependent methyltransferase [Lutimaribacter pacificus]SDN86892.1 Ubiquinone/menaquinone biosynthesis C-methylase UbiE [Lutimaribacter pacificus]SHK42104.1 Ubiquinone/menaquinone biosynthesis C-methylase UbiE [Lutimaribacter pacificus]